MSVVVTTRAPEPVGPYSQGRISGRYVFLSGQIPLVPATGNIIQGDIDEQARLVFDNLREVCRAVSGDLSDVVRVGIYLVDLDHFPVVNQVMAEYFASPYPARSTVGVAGLPLKALVEIDAIAVLPEEAWK